ncbi:MAG: hypothetical protein MI862_12650 [Desulfobacterales bacterium]|nr:hypothetical protein [Desulfobacterales bacterium]
MLFDFFKRKKKPVDEFQLALEDDDKLYYETIAGRTPRDPNNIEEYILFIDFGSYRTSVLCWPCRYGRDRITDSWQYVVHFDGDNQGGFPSAFINPPSGDERDFAFVSKVNEDSISSSQVVKSAKYAFASKFAAYRGDVPQFKLYIKKILEQSFKYITEPKEDRPWNGPAIPTITEVRVTVPDLFIENLRAGYRENIFSVCMNLSSHRKWKSLFPSNLQHLRRTFVNISSDESGACELYFLNLIKLIPFWELSGSKDRAPRIEEVNFLFSQNRPGHTGKDHLDCVICHIDIGGLTTDVSILLTHTYHDPILGITTTLKRKESFSEKKAGEYFADCYAQTKGGDDEENWWESERFINKDFSRFLGLLSGKQAVLLKEWRGEKELDGFYFLVSGRPTKSPLVKKAISRHVLKEFNKEELILLPEHCLFMADYYHVGKNEEGERYAKKIDHFEKLITLLGNVYTLYDGYDIDFENHKYFISLDMDNRNTNQMEVVPGKVYNMETFENYKKAASKNNVNHLAFTRIQGGEHTTRFLTVKTIARQTAYPAIKVAKANEYDDQAWIMPSLIITNLEQNEQAFDLAWATLS